MSSFETPLTQAEKRAWLRAVMRRKDISHGAKLCAWGLVERHNTESGQLNPSLERIAEDVGISRRGAVSAIGELEAAGLIEVAPGARRKGKQGVNRYRLVMVQNLHSVERDRVQNLLAQSAEQGAGQSAELALEPLNSEPLREPMRAGARDDRAGKGSLPDERAVLAAIARRYEPAIVRAWIRPASPRFVAPGLLELTPRTRLARDWLVSNRENIGIAAGAGDVVIVDPPRQNAPATAPATSSGGEGAAAWPPAKATRRAG